MPIYKIYDTLRDSNRLIGYLLLNENDFNVTREDGITKRVPNMSLYKKVKKELNKDWKPTYVYRKLNIKEVEDLIASYDKKQNYYANQYNRLKTLKDL